MNSGPLVLNYMDPTSFLQSTSERLPKFTPVGPIWFQLGGLSLSHILIAVLSFLVKAYRLGL